MNLGPAFYLIVCLLTFFVGSANAGERINFDADWKFLLNDPTGAEWVEYNDAAWRSLYLPHDWSIEAKYDEASPMTDRCGYLAGGIGWYRKTIAVPSSWKGRQVELAFDGVFMNSTVWVNGQKLGTRPYGWVSFEYDISAAVAASDHLTIAVRVDNELQPAARWYTGSGIYAHTWLTVRDAVHVPSSGVFVRTENNSDVLVDTEVINKGAATAKGVLITSVLSPSGSVLATQRENFKLNANKNTVVAQKLALQNPELWSVDTPTLYTVMTQVKIGDEIVDAVRTPFGVRDIQWVAETGLWINGKNVKMRGACLQGDAGALGTAIPDKILRFRIQQLKDMGLNAIRVAHKAQTPTFYDLCDEIGMMVMDEFFDGWMKKADCDYGARFFDEWWERDLTDLVKRDRNHPSVVLYSIGNETHGEVGKEMVQVCHKNDPTRFVTSGNCEPQDMDVYGVNGGSEAKTFFDTLDTGGKAFIGTENPHTWHNRGFYRTQFWYRDGYMGKKGAGKAHYYPNLTMNEIFTYDWTDGSDRTHSRQTLRSDYDNSSISVTVRHNIELLRDTPNFAGSFRWTAYDYLGEARYHGGWPFKSFSGGAMDLANFEKNLFYLYQSQWTTKPMVHVLPHWTHPTMKLGTEIPVWVYSNCDQVELFFNGKSLGKQEPGKRHTDMQCQWMVAWQPGELKAVGSIDGTVVQEEVVRTATAPSQLKLSVDGEPMAAAARDIVQVRVASADAQGTFYPYGENRTYFHVIGSCKVRALDNGSPLDVEKHFDAESRIGFFGLTRAYIESTDAAGDVALLASSIIGEKKQVSSNKVSIDTELIVLRGALPDTDIQVYYTTDGSQPTAQSSLYRAPFEIPFETTVKALVVLNGQPIHQMKERFSKNAGFSWVAADPNAVASGEQAESGKLEKATVVTAGKGFSGKGYIEFDKGSAKTGFVEVYFENDRSAGDFELWVRYSAAGKKGQKQRALLAVNGREQEIKLTAAAHYRKDWKVFKGKGSLDAGANYIKLTPLDNIGLCVDEVIVK